MLGSFLMLWMLARGASGAAKAPAPTPQWPTPRHPPPSRLPKRKPGSGSPAKPTSRAKPPARPQSKPAPSHARPQPASRPRPRPQPPPQPPPPVPETPAMPDIPMPETLPPVTQTSDTRVTTTRSPEGAAADLYAYVSDMLKRRKGGQLGTRGKPNQIVKEAQTDMGVPADGIYGPTTRARGKALLGKNFPPRVSGIDGPLYIP